MLPGGMVSLKGSRTAEDCAFDQAVGARIRYYRLIAGLSQTVVARAAGITFQQLQKYESGGNRVAASRLAAIARALDAPIARLLGEGDDPPQMEAFTAEESQFLSNYRRAPGNGKKALRMLAASFAQGGEAPAGDGPGSST